MKLGVAENMVKNMKKTWIKKPLSPKNIHAAFLSIAQEMQGSSKRPSPGDGAEQSLKAVEQKAKHPFVTYTSFWKLRVDVLFQVMAGVWRGRVPLSCLSTSIDNTRTHTDTHTHTYRRTQTYTHTHRDTHEQTHTNTHECTQTHANKGEHTRTHPFKHSPFPRIESQSHIQPITQSHIRALCARAMCAGYQRACACERAFSNEAPKARSSAGGGGEEYRG